MKCLRFANIPAYRLSGAADPQMPASEAMDHTSSPCFRCVQVHIAEIGSGSGGTSAVVMSGLGPFADAVEFLYTDISPALVGYGRKTYGGAFPFARFQLLDVDRDVECQGCAAGSYDIVFATNVLHATANMGRTLSNCKVMLRKGEAFDMDLR